MNIQPRATCWRATIGSLVLVTGVFSMMMESPVEASSKENNIIAQVGVRSRITRPTPLPTRESIQLYDYNGNPIYEQSRQGNRHRRFRRHGRFNRHRRFERYGRNSLRHRRNRRYQGNNQRYYYPDNRRRRIYHRRNHGNFGGLIIKKKF